MGEEQKSTAINWVQVLTPIIVAMIGLIPLLYEKCNCSPTTSAPDDKPPHVHTPSVIPPVKADHRQDSIVFTGTVVSIYGATGIKGANVTIMGTIITQTDEKGVFQIKIPKGLTKISINADHRMFKSRFKEFSSSQSGSAIIELLPK